MKPLISVPAFCRLVERLNPYLTTLTFLLFITGLPWGLWFSPPDYQQGETVRIIYIHVPAAFLSLFVYVMMAVCSGLYFVLHLKIMETFAKTCCELGACFTLLALLTGSLWGKPMWGTFWVWDARLTSELVLLFLYLGIIALRQSIACPRRAANAAAILTFIGVVNVPVVHFSVNWWFTLHQGAAIGNLAFSHVATPILYPLLTMIMAFFCLFALILLNQSRYKLLTDKIIAKG